MESLKDGLETRERALTQHYRNLIKYMYRNIYYIIYTLLSGLYQHCRQISQVGNHQIASTITITITITIIIIIIIITITIIIIIIIIIAISIVVVVILVVVVTLVVSLNARDQWLWPTLQLGPPCHDGLVTVLLFRGPGRLQRQLQNKRSPAAQRVMSISYSVCSI